MGSDLPCREHTQCRPVVVPFQSCKNKGCLDGCTKAVCKDRMYGTNRRDNECNMIFMRNLYVTYIPQQMHNGFVSQFWAIWHKQADQINHRSLPLALYYYTILQHNCIDNFVFFINLYLIHQYLHQVLQGLQLNHKTCKDTRLSNYQQ